MNENQVVTVQQGDIFYMPDKDQHSERPIVHPYMVISKGEPKPGQKVICVSLTSTEVENAENFIPIKFGKTKSYINPHTPYSYMLSEFRFDGFRGHCTDDKLIDLVLQILMRRFGVESDDSKMAEYLLWFDAMYPDLPGYISNEKQEKLLADIVDPVPEPSVHVEPKESKIKKPQILTIGLPDNLKDWDDENLLEFFDCYNKIGCMTTSTKYHMTLSDCPTNYKTCCEGLVQRGLKTRDEVSAFRHMCEITL